MTMVVVIYQEGEQNDNEMITGLENGRTIPTWESPAICYSISTKRFLT